MDCIDLESSCTWVNGKRSDDWYVVYCNFAEDLSRQGYTVFVSSHEVVRKQLCSSSEDVYVCCPALELKEAWLKRLRLRYEKSVLDKDYRAWKNAEERYTDNVLELMRSGFPILLIEVADSSVADVLPES